MSRGAAATATRSERRARRAAAAAMLNALLLLLLECASPSAPPPPTVLLTYHLRLHRAPHGALSLGLWAHLNGSYLYSLRADNVTAAGPDSGERPAAHVASTCVAQVADPLRNATALLATARLLNASVLAAVHGARPGEGEHVLDAWLRYGDDGRFACASRHRLEYRVDGHAIYSDSFAAPSLAVVTTVPAWVNAADAAVRETVERECGDGGGGDVGDAHDLWLCAGHGTRDRVADLLHDYRRHCFPFLWRVRAPTLRFDLDRRGDGRYLRCHAHLGSPPVTTLRVYRRTERGGARLVPSQVTGPYRLRDKLGHRSDATETRLQSLAPAEDGAEYRCVAHHLSGVYSARVIVHPRSHVALTVLVSVSGVCVAALIGVAAYVVALRLARLTGRLFP